MTEGDAAPAEGRFLLADFYVRGLIEEQYRARPDGWNSVAWLFWHMAYAKPIVIGVQPTGRQR